MAAPRKYPDELRERAIRLVLDAKAGPGSGGKNVYRRISDPLRVNPVTLRGWVKPAEIEAGAAPGTTTEVLSGRIVGRQLSTDLHGELGLIPPVEHEARHAAQNVPRQHVEA